MRTWYCTYKCWKKNVPYYFKPRVVLLRRPSFWVLILLCLELKANNSASLLRVFRLLFLSYKHRSGIRLLGYKTTKILRDNQIQKMHSGVQRQLSYRCTTPHDNTSGITLSKRHSVVFLVGGVISSVHAPFIKM